MNNIRVAAFLAKRENLGELLDAADAAKRKFDSLLERDGGPHKETPMMPDTVAALADYRRLSEDVFQQNEVVEKERNELVKLGLLKARI